MTNEELITTIRNKVERQFSAFLNLSNASQEYGYHKALEFILSILSDIEESEKQEVNLERDAVQFCFDKGLNITPYQAKTIASHFYELGKNSK
jgi:hypothetical protein